MRKTLYIIALAAVVVLTVVGVITAKKNDYGTIYTVEAVVYQVRFDEKLTIFVDSRGEAWYWEGTEVPIAGTRVLLTMDNHNNQWLIDDAIISFKVL